MKFEELQQKIYAIGLSSVGYEDFSFDELPLKLVHAIGGGEGGGEYAERVFVHENNGESIYVKITGSYSSYEGTDWYDVSEVKPTQKTITVYE